MAERVLVCGDRYWTDYQTIMDTLSKIQQERGIDVVIEGEAEGADKMGAQAARVLGIPVLPFPADWRKWGHNAGPMRNIQMLEEGNPTLVLAFHDFIKNSKGTHHMIQAAEKAGVKWEVLKSSKRRPKDGKEKQSPS